MFAGGCQSAGMMTMRLSAPVSRTSTEQCRLLAVVRRPWEPGNSTRHESTRLAGFARHSCPCTLQAAVVRRGVRPQDKARALKVHAQVRSTDSEVDSCLETSSQDSVLEDDPVQIQTSTWKWGEYDIRYQVAGVSGPALLLVHGFGANCDHWRKNIPVLARSHRVFAIDLLGYGYSDKPSPRMLPPNSLYTFDTWAKQILQFCAEVVNDRPFIICNSVGGIAGLQAAILEQDTVRGLLLLNVSLRMLHINKQPWYARPFVKALQDVLRNTDLGQRFFKSVAKPDAVKRILCQCYHDDSAVTDELVQLILQPGLQPGAVDVFLDFICYSGGPLAEEMLPLVECPVWIGWGEKDPWEPIALGRAYEKFDTVEEFIVLPNAGHCPQDEAPHLVNPLVERFVAKHANR